MCRDLIKHLKIESFVLILQKDYEKDYEEYSISIINMSICRG